MNKCEHHYIVIGWKITDKVRNANNLMCCKCTDIIDYDDLLRIFKYKHKVKMSQSSDDLILDGRVLVGTAEVITPSDGSIRE